MDVLFVSTNPGKVREVRDLLAPFGLRVRWSRRRLPELQADSLEEVAAAKLRAVPPRHGPVLVEDSGLFIEALRGFPGVYSAHILATWRFGPILELLRSRPRRAEFRTVAAVRWGRRVRFFRGRTLGAISRVPRGDQGFGFDPIFVPDGESRTYAQMSRDEKARTSHRARAIRAAGRWLRSRQ